MLFYSQTTGGFYATDIHGNNIPPDAVEITEEDHAKLLAGQSSGKRISANEVGFPVLVDPPPAPPTPAPVDPVQKLRAFLGANPDVAALLQ